MPYSEQDCIDALREAAEIIGETPSRRQYEVLGLKPSATSIKRIIGGWNAAKTQAGIELLSQGDRYNNPISPEPPNIEIPEEQTWETLTPQQRWYYKNRDHRISVKEDRIKRLRQWLSNYKRNFCDCERCGEEFAACLDFHHDGEKTNNISKMVNAGYSVRRLREEIEKCRVLCANCHQKEHHPVDEWATKSGSIQFPVISEKHKFDFNDNRKRRANLRHWVFTYKARSSGCSTCEVKDPRCLEFHHIDPGSKDGTIGQMIANQPPLSKLFHEISKCKIVCRNCHRKHHQKFAIDAQ